MTLPRTILLFLAIALLACDDPEVLVVSITPDQIDPGGSFSVEYVIGGKLSKIRTIVLTGLPANTTGGGNPIPLTIPTDNVSTSHNVTVTIPAKDGTYKPRVEITFKGGSSSMAAGALVINDRPAALSQVTITPPTHSTSNNCRDATNGIFQREWEYHVEDDNGAYDVDRAFISDAIPLDGGNTITDPPPVSLALPTASNQTGETVNTTINVKCDMADQVYKIRMKILDLDASTTPPTPAGGVDASYTVTK